MTRLSLLVLSLSSCSAWQFPEPSPRWPRPPGFGVTAWDGAPLRPTVIDSVVSGGSVFVAVHQGPGRDAELERVSEPTLDLIEVNLRSGLVTARPAVPGRPAPVELWPSAVPSGVLARRDAWVASFDGSSWRELPVLPSTRVDLVRQVDGDHVVLRAGAQLWVLSGNAWRSPALPADVVAAAWGPAVAGRARVVWTNGAGLCTAIVRLADGALDGVPVCSAGFVELGGDSLNGTLDAFTTWSKNPRDIQLLAFSNGAWTRGRVVRGDGLRWTPASPDAVVSSAVTGTIPLQNLTRAVGGQVTEALFVQSWELFGCDGLRPCARGLGAVEAHVSDDGTQALFVLENVVDGRRSIYVKSVSLPHRDEGSCSPACSAAQLCVRGSSIANLCVADPSKE